MGDVDFDTRLRTHLGDIVLFDGVMGQCSRTFEFLSGKGVPLVLTALNTHIDNLIETLTDEYRRLQLREPIFVHPYMRKRIHHEIERAVFIRVISETAKQSFIDQGVPSSKIEVIHPAIDLDHFRPVTKLDDTFRVMAVISIEPRKGLHYLLEAFEKAAIPGSELVIIGGTWDRWSSQMLRYYMSRMSNVSLQSANVMKEPVEQTYGRASVLVHPAVEDGFALAVGQALACGKPVIVTRQTGAAEIVQDGKAGYIVECRDVDGIVDRLRLLVRNESLLNRLAEAAPMAVSNLGYPAVAQRVTRLYDRMLA